MNGNLQTIVKELLNGDDVTVRESRENFAAALRARGIDEDEITATVEALDGFPLGDDALEAISGGSSIVRPSIL